MCGICLTTSVQQKHIPDIGRTESQCQVSTCQRWASVLSRRSSGTSVVPIGKCFSGQGRWGEDRTGCGKGRIGPEDWWRPPPLDPMPYFGLGSLTRGLSSVCQPNSQCRLKYTHCESQGFTGDKGTNIPVPKEILVAAAAPIGCGSSHFGAAAPMVTGQLRIGLPMANSGWPK